MNKTSLVFDIGASNTRIAVSRDGKKLSSIKKYTTSKSYSKGLSLIKEFVASHGNIKAAAGGIAGSIDKKTGATFKAPNLPDWSGRRLAWDLSQILKTKIKIENDTALAGLGEAIRGAGKGNKIVAYITLSTGINGALVINGELVPSAQGFEIGHQIIDNGKTLEYFVGGANIEKRYKKTPEEVLKSEQGKIIVKQLSVGLVNTILYWSPEVLVLGGAQMKSLSIANIKKHSTKRLNVFPRLPVLKKASLGDLSGLLGALELLK